MQRVEDGHFSVRFNVQHLEDAKEREQRTNTSKEREKKIMETNHFFEGWIGSVSSCDCISTLRSEDANHAHDLVKSPKLILNKS